tara:strand:- start:72 stop:536 length:465 start_codon:yes stop_codon:yes gene_type:complete
MIDIPENWKQAEARVYLPKYIKYPDIFLQSKINNYNNIFDNCFGHTKIQSSDIDGIYHLSHRGSENSNKDVFVIIESKIGNNFNGGQEILAKSITSDLRFYYLILFFEKEDRLQQNPYAASLIYKSEYVVKNHKTNKYKLNKWMKGLSKKQNII